jgi:hypothetical protein
VATKGQVMRKGAPLRHRAAVPELGVGAMGVGVRGYVVGDSAAAWASDGWG